MQKITSSIVKLIQHENICNGNFTPVSSQIVLTDLCNLDCSFCTAGGKMRTDKNKFSKDQVFNILEDMKSLGCKGIEYTGGGEPTLHKEFIKIVNKTAEMGFDIGLVTNGTTIEKLSGSINWSKFDWIRVSINAGSDNYKKVHGVDLFKKVMQGIKILSDYIPKRFGVSYIYSDQPIEDVDNLLKNIYENAPNTGYVRIGADIKKYLVDMPDVISVLNKKVEDFYKNTGIFSDVQTTRDTSVPNKCYMGKVKPSINADGSVYPCCIAQHKKFGKLCNVKDYKDNILNGTLKEINTVICPYCIYRHMNDFMQEIDSSVIKNKNFI